METKQLTAVEWMVKQLNINGTVIPMEIESKAKEMEKEHIMNAYIECWENDGGNGFHKVDEAEQYYNETFKSK